MKKIMTILIACSLTLSARGSNHPLDGIATQAKRATAWCASTDTKIAAAGLALMINGGRIMAHRRGGIGALARVVMGHTLIALGTAGVLLSEAASKYTNEVNDLCRQKIDTHRAQPKN